MVLSGKIPGQNLLYLHGSEVVHVVCDDIFTVNVFI